MSHVFAAMVTVGGYMQAQANHMTNKEDMPLDCNIHIQLNEKIDIHTQNQHCTITQIFVFGLQKRHFNIMTM